MKSAVEASVVHQVRLSGGISRIELARELKIAPSTIGIYVERLVRGGYLQEGGRRNDSSAGRPPTILELNPDAGQFIGVDLDGREIRAVSVDFAQSTISKHTCPIPPDSAAPEVVELLAQVIERVNSNRHHLFGIGFAVPGTIDMARGVALRYRHIRDWVEVPLAEMMRNQFGVPIYLENNIRSMALAERWFGQGRELRDYLCIGIRSGIGSGLVLRGELYRGSDNVAGEIGSWPCIDPQTGESKTLEDIASIPSLLRRLESSLDDGETCLSTLIEEVESGNPHALSALEVAAKVLGGVIAQIHLLVNSERVIIAGPLASMQDSFLTPLRESVAQHLRGFEATQPAIHASQFDAFIGALGAAACAVHDWQPA